MAETDYFSLEPGSDSEANFERITRALEELHEHRNFFSEDSYSLIARLLLDARRTSRTIEDPSYPRTDEIRLVTVMFVDVHESTKLAHTLGAGEWKDLIEGAHAGISNVVSQWDGQVGQYLGDGVLCFFGAQHSQGDDALRGVSCALAIQEYIYHYANDAFLEHGIEFAVRIGISTGRVVVGMIGTEENRKMLAMGLTTNLAGRLQTLANPGEILVDVTTYGRVRNHFIVIPRPPVRLRGFDDPVAYYVIVARGTRTATQFTETMLRGIPLPFVGRDDVMADLEKRIISCRGSDEFQTMFVTGDIGIGKSRLLQEVLEMQTEHDAHCLVMVAHYETRNTPWNLLHSLLVNACHLTQETEPEIALQKITEFITGLWDHPAAGEIANTLASMTGFMPATTVALNQSLGSVMRVVARWFRAVAKDKPLILLVDNLQWADAASLRFLVTLNSHLRESQGMLLCAMYITYMQAHPDYFHEFHKAETLILEPLPLEITRDVVDLVLNHVERVPPTIAPIINDRASGNPFFVQALLEMLFENNVFELQEDGSWRFDMMEYEQVLAMPDSLMGVFQARLDDLPLQAREVLQIAAICGQTFWGGALTDLLPWSLPPLLDILRSRGIIARQTVSDFPGETQYVFQHTLYRDVAYDMLPRNRRQPYHHHIAEWLSERITAQPDYYTLLIQQLIAAEKYPSALSKSLEGAKFHISNEQPGSAMLLVDRGLGVARNVPRDIALPVTCQLWALRCQSLILTEEYNEALSAGKSALMLIDEQEDESLQIVRLQIMGNLAQAHLKLEHYDEAGRLIKEAAELQQALHPEEASPVSQSIDYGADGEETALPRPPEPLSLDESTVPPAPYGLGEQQLEETTETPIPVDLFMRRNNGHVNDPAEDESVQTGDSDAESSNADAL